MRLLNLVGASGGGGSGGLGGGLGGGAGRLRVLGVLLDVRDASTPNPNPNPNPNPRRPSPWSPAAALAGPKPSEPCP
jgi:hypothetical protein